MDNFDLINSDFAIPDNPTDLPVVQPRQPVNHWDPRLILDLAVGIDDLEAILPRYDLTQLEFQHLSNTPSFRRELALAIRDVNENGIPFARKAKIQAETYLEVLDHMVYDEATPATVRLEAIRSIVKWGRLEPPKETQADATNATQINVNISF